MAGARLTGAFSLLAAFTCGVAALHRVSPVPTSGAFPGRVGVLRGYLTLRGGASGEMKFQYGKLVPKNPRRPTEEQHDARGDGFIGESQLKTWVEEHKDCEAWDDAEKYMHLDDYEIEERDPNVEPCVPPARHGTMGSR